MGLGKRLLISGILIITLLIEINIQFQQKRATHILPFTYTSQLYPLNADDACEAASLKMALSVSKPNFHLSLLQVINRMPKSKSNPNQGFTGSPYHVSPKTNVGTIYPKPLARYARNLGFHAKNISKDSLKQIVQQLKHGHPVIFVGASRMKNTSSYHVPVIVGYRPGSLLIADPYMNQTASNKVYWVTNTHFEKIFNAKFRHQRAVEIG